MAQILSKDFSARPSAARMFEDVVGCKWSLGVLELIRHGICRPGAMEHSMAGNAN